MKLTINNSEYYSFSMFLSSDIREMFFDLEPFEHQSLKHKGKRITTKKPHKTCFYLTSRINLQVTLLLIPIFKVQKTGIINTDTPYLLLYSKLICLSTVNE